MTDESNEFGSGEFGGQFSSGAANDVTTILSDALKQTGVSASDTTYRDIALSFLNTIYKTTLKGRHWRFTNSELFVELAAPYEAGTVTLNDGDHSVIEYVADGDAPATKWNSTHVGMAFCPSEPPVAGNYRIDSIDSISKMTILPGFAVQSTGTSPVNTSYRILNDRFLLDQKVQDVKSLTPLGYQEMKPVGLQEFRTKKSRDPCLTGIPTHYTTFSSKEQGGQLTIEVYPNPDQHYSFHVEYNERVTRLEDSETCYTMIPPEHSDVLVLALRAAIYQDQNNAAMASAVGSEARIAWNRMAGDQSMTDSRARLQHGRNYFNRRNRVNVSYGLKHFGKFD